MVGRETSNEKFMLLSGKVSGLKKDIPEAEILLDILKFPDNTVFYLGNLERSDLFLLK